MLHNRLPPLDWVGFEIAETVAAEIPRDVRVLRHRGVDLLVVDVVPGDALSVAVDLCLMALVGRDGGVGIAARGPAVLIALDRLLELPEAAVGWALAGEASVGQDGP